MELKDGEISAFSVTPEDVGLRRAAPAALKGGDPAHNAAALRESLAGARNAYRDIALFNAAAALVVAGIAAISPKAWRSPTRPSAPARRRRRSRDSWPSPTPEALESGPL